MKSSPLLARDCRISPSTRFTCVSAKKLVCFEELQITRMTAHFFRASKEVDLHRDRASEYCGLRSLAAAEIIAGTRRVQGQLHVLFYERATQRTIRNAEAMCEMVRNAPWVRNGVAVRHASWEGRIIDYNARFCDRVAMMRWAGIIVTMSGGHVEIVYQALPGTVLIVVHPLMGNAQPSYKDLLRPASMSVLDFAIPGLEFAPQARPEKAGLGIYQIDPPFPECDITVTSPELHDPVLLLSPTCRMWWFKTRDIVLPPTLFACYVQSAARLLVDDADEHASRSCMQPAMPCPGGVPGNWEPCLATECAEFFREHNTRLVSIIWSPKMASYFKSGVGVTCGPSGVCESSRAEVFCGLHPRPESVLCRTDVLAGIKKAFMHYKKASSDGKVAEPVEAALYVTALRQFAGVHATQSESELE